MRGCDRPLVGLRLCNRSFADCAGASARGSEVAAAHEPLAADLDGDMRPDLLAAFVAEDAMCNASGTCTAKEGDDCGVKGSPNCCECGLVCGGGKAGDYFARARKCEKAPPPVARAWFNRPHKHAGKDGASSRFAVGPLFGAADLNGSRRDAACAALPPPPPSPPPLRLATPHSNAHADLDGDCVADLLVVALPSSADGDGCASCANASCELHIWTQRPGAEGKNETRWAAEGAAEEEGHAVFALPYGAGQLGVADMDGDGRIDLVFAATDAKNRTSLHVWYTVRQPGAAAAAARAARAERAAGAGGGASRCGGAADALPPSNDALCSRPAGATLRFDRRAFALPKGWRLPTAADYRRWGSADDRRPPTLSLGDFDLDGYADVLLPLVAPPKDDKGAAADAAPCKPDEACVVVVHNDACLRSSSRDALPIVAQGRTPDFDADDFFGLPLLAGATAAAWFDLYNDGVWDVLGAYPNGSLTAWRQLSNDGGDYFIKLTTADGTCPAVTSYGGSADRAADRDAAWIDALPNSGGGGGSAAAGRARRRAAGRRRRRASARAARRRSASTLRASRTSSSTSGPPSGSCSPPRRRGRSTGRARRAPASSSRSRRTRRWRRRLPSSASARPTTTCRS